MLSDLSQYFNSPAVQTAVSVLRIVFISLSALMLGFIIFGIFKTTWLRKLILWDIQEFITYRPYGVKKLYKQWQKTRRRLSTGMESEYKLAVIESDSMMDDILKRMGFAGETLGERLEKISEATITNLSDTLNAHKIRNSVVHDPDYRLTLEEAKYVIDTYEKALTDLQAL
jgi:hypothetical protein